MRIGFFSPAINRIGGGEWVTVNMINALKAKGHEIMIYSEEKIDTEGIFQFFGRRLLFDEEVHLWPYIFDPYDPKSIYDNILRSFIFKSKCDLLIDTFSNNLLPWNDAVYFQGSAFVSSIPQGRKSLFFLPFESLLRNFRNSSSYKDRIAMACSRFSARMIEDAVGHKIEVLYPPLSDFYKLNEVDDTCRSKTVITISRFAKEKRLELVANIAKMTSNDFRFIIAGACRCLDDLRSVQKSIRDFHVEKKVELMPNISRARLRDIARESKVCLHTGVDEPFGISILEAMASGCIPVVPNSGGPKEFVPRQLRYENVEEAAFLIESSMSDWSQQKAEDFIAVSDGFGEERFAEEFLRIMRL
jgi:alpha-1,2-mannosyltransferase